VHALSCDARPYCGTADEDSNPYMTSLSASARMRTVRPSHSSHCARAIEGSPAGACAALSSVSSPGAGLTLFPHRASLVSLLFAKVLPSSEDGPVKGPARAEPMLSTLLLHWDLLSRRQQYENFPPSPSTNTISALEAEKIILQAILCHMTSARRQKSSPAPYKRVSSPRQFSWTKRVGATKPLPRAGQETSAATSCRMGIVGEGDRESDVLCDQAR